MSKLIVISAPSGAGKTTLVLQLVKKLYDLYGLKRIITYTTKKPRASEKHGHDYFFISVEEFKTKIEEGFFVEWSTAYNNYYGSPRQPLALIEQGIPHIVVLDIRGAASVKTEYPSSVCIWLKPPCIEVLKERLEIRGEDSAEEKAFRLRLAEHELREAEKGIFDYTVTADKIDETVQEIERIFSVEILGN